MVGKYGGALSSLPSVSKYATDISAAAAVRTGKTFDAKQISQGIGSLDDEILIDIFKNLKPDTVTDILNELPDYLRKSMVADLKAAGIPADLSRQLDALDDIAKTGDELADMTYLANPTTKLTGNDVTKVNNYFSGLSETALDIEADRLVNSWSTTGRTAFDKLPVRSKETLLKNSQSLRYQAKRSSDIADYLKGACKSAPVFCDVGKGLGGLGAAVGVGFALEAVYDKVMRELDNDDDIAACIATCYPNDWYDSEASGVGDKDYKDLDFKTIEGLKESTGNDDITQANTPLCTASMTGESCATMCNERCEELNKTFLQKVAGAVGGLARDVVDESSDVAGTGLKGFLDGFFGEGMGIPSAIGIVIFIIILMVLVTTM